MSLMQREDFKGNVAKRIKLADEKTISPKDMISIISKGNEGIDEYFGTKREKTIEEHKSMLDDFQL